MLRSEGQEIYAVQVNKMSPSPFDSKRHVVENALTHLQMDTD